MTQRVWIKIQENVLANVKISPVDSGFGGLVVSILASGTQDRKFEPGQSHRISWAKKPQHVVLRRGSKAVCSMSQICGM
jgi:hypothetical protein